MKQTPQPSRIGSGCRITDHEVREPLADLLEGIVRFDAPAEEHHVEAVRFREVDEDLGSEFLERLRAAGDEDGATARGAMRKCLAERVRKLPQEQRGAVEMNG